MFHKGQQIGPYVLVREVGRGSFGVVWEAEEPMTFANATRRVAAKLPVSDDIDLNEFRKEAEIWVKAEWHPNVLPLLAAGIFSGQVLIASQFAPDGTLSNWLRQNGPSVDSAILMISGILRGLRHLHSKNIVHRDLKPGNVLLQGQEPQIADFGLARVLRTDASTCRPAGTPAYMAPEVWERNDRCFQADLWAVGIMLHEMLCGSKPFTGADHQRLEEAIRHKEPSPLPSHVPESLRLIVDKALQKNKQERFQSAADMLQTLSAMGQVPAAGRQEELSIPTTVASPPNHSAEARNARGMEKMMRGDMDGALFEFNEAIQLDPQFYPAYCNRGLVKRHQKDIGGALDDFNRAIELKPDYADAYNNRGMARVDQVDVSGAFADYSAAIDLAPQHGGAYFNRALLKWRIGDKDAAKPDFRKAIELMPQLREVYQKLGLPALG